MDWLELLITAAIVGGFIYIARIWGKGHYDGQMVGREDLLRDQDLIEIHT